MAKKICGGGKACCFCDCCWGCLMPPPGDVAKCGWPRMDGAEDLPLFRAWPPGAGPLGWWGVVWGEEPGSGPIFAAAGEALGLPDMLLAADDVCDATVAAAAVGDEEVGAEAGEGLIPNEIC